MDKSAEQSLATVFAAKHGWEVATIEAESESSMTPSRDVPPAVGSDRDAILAFVRERDVLCPLCGYNLRNLPEPRCPECGRQLELKVGLVKPFFGGWIAAFAATAPGAGVGLAFIWLTPKEGIPHWSDGWFLLFYLWAILMVPLSVTLIFARNRFLRLSPPAQIRIAAVLLGIAAIMAVIVFGKIL